MTYLDTVLEAVKLSTTGSVLLSFSTTNMVSQMMSSIEAHLPARVRNLATGLADYRDIYQ